MFFDENVLLHSNTAIKLYSQIKDLPIIDYHCHLDQSKVKSDAGFSDIGELWLACDHYKWRAMRICGVDERYITGNASYKEKFIKYAEIVPQLIGNPLYYFTHLELRQIFGITLPLNKDTAESIYKDANAVLCGLSVRRLLSRFNVEYIATTDDPCDDLSAHGKYDKITVAPTFRPDKAYDPGEYIARLEAVTGKKIKTAEEYFDALVARLDYFVSRGCKITDHGFESFPQQYIDDGAAEKLFLKRNDLTESERKLFFGWLIVKLTREYKKRNLVMQLHFAVIRNNNAEMLKCCGVDSGFDLIGEQQPVKDVVRFFNQVKDDERPQTIVYTLNDSNIAALSCITGAFRNVRMGAAWWFNDTLQGIKRNLSTMAEYSVLGTSLGMLTDSRSFSSYCRFDFFRRIVSDYVAEKVVAGEYDENAAAQLLYNICYANPKAFLNL